MPHEVGEALGTAKGGARSATNKQASAQSDFQLMMEKMVSDGEQSLPATAAT